MKNFRFLVPLILLMIVSSCGEKSLGKSEETKTEAVDSVKSAILNVSGELFSIPSPIQTALLIEESNAAYNPDLLNEPEQYSEYQTNNEKALNLGVYGADMAYSSIYGNAQASILYFRAIDNLAKDLGLASAISPHLIKRLGANAEKPDSLLFLTGRFYEEGDAYLKKNERYDVASMIILGGWVESNHLTAQAALSGNEDAKKRVAEQKESSSTLMKVLGKTTNESFLNSDLYAVLDSLAEAYSIVEKTYSFVQPQTYADRKTTKIRSQTEYMISDSLLEELAALTASARNKITEK